MFSKRTFDLLEAAGWVPLFFKNVNTEEDLLKVKGYPLGSRVKKSPEEFSGIRVDRPHARVAGAMDFFKSMWQGLWLKLVNLELKSILKWSVNLCVQ